MAVLIVHGGQDATDLTAANNYETNLTNLINGIRTYLPNVRIILLNYPNTSDASEIYRATVMQARVNVSNNLTNISLIDASTYETGAGSHFTPNGYIQGGVDIYNVLVANNLI